MKIIINPTDSLYKGKINEEDWLISQFRGDSIKYKNHMYLPPTNHESSNLNHAFWIINNHFIFKNNETKINEIQIVNIPIKLNNLDIEKIISDNKNEDFVVKFEKENFEKFKITIFEKEALKIPFIYYYFENSPSYFQHFYQFWAFCVNKKFKVNYKVDSTEKIINEKYSNDCFENKIDFMIKKNEEWNLVNSGNEGKIFRSEKEGNFIKKEVKKETQNKLKYLKKYEPKVKWEGPEVFYKDLLDVKYTSKKEVHSYEYENIILPTTDFSFSKIANFLIEQFEKKIFIIDVKKENFAKIINESNPFSKLIYSDFGKAFITIEKNLEEFFIGLCRDYYVFAKEYKSWKYRDDIRIMRDAIALEQIIKIEPKFEIFYKFIKKGYDNNLYPCHNEEDLKTLKANDWKTKFRICTKNSGLQFSRKTIDGENKVNDFNKHKVYNCSYNFDVENKNIFNKKIIYGPGEFLEEVAISYEYQKKNIIALITTTGTRNLSKTIDSINNQTKKVSQIVIASEIPIKSKLQVYVNPYKKGLARNTMQSLVNLFLEHDENVYVATIDDDDQWDSNYIEEVIKKINQGANVIFTSLKVYKNNNFHSKMILDKIDANTFLYENPGVQGSNKVFNLGLALESGGMPKHINASTDRAFNINLLEHPEIKLAIIKKPLVIFNQDPSRERISNNLNRLPELQKFYKTYWNRIDESKKNDINQRHENLHDFKKVIWW